MADIFTKAKRSLIMSRIRSTGTKPEERLRGLVRAIAGPRKVRAHARLKGVRVDFYIPSLKLAIFCDGCFYHCCPEHGHIPKSNIAYWKPKLARNAKRDKEYRATLRKHGFKVWRAWEHELKPSVLPKTMRRLARTLAAPLSAPCPN